MDWRIAHVVRGAGVPAGAPHGWGGAAVAAGGCLRFCAADADFPAAGSSIVFRPSTNFSTAVDGIDA